MFALWRLWNRPVLRRITGMIERVPAWQLVFAVTFTVYLIAIISYAVAGAVLTQDGNSVPTLTGDEPHYLIITQSLLEDHDIAIQNNYDNGGYLAFYPGDLSEDLHLHSVRDIQGDLISIHGFGLPLLLCVPFALGGLIGARLFMALVGALSACIMLKILMRLGFSRKISLLATLSAFVTSPLIFYGYSVYTEMVTLFFILLSTLVLLDIICGKSASSLKCLGAGACLAFLPWLGVKYGIITVAFTIVFLYYYLKKKARLSQLLAVILPVAISIMLYEGMMHAEFGSLNPVKVYSGLDASYGPNVVVYTEGSFQDRIMDEIQSLFSLDINIFVVSLFNRFFDGHDGIFFFAPIYLLSIGGILLYLFRPLKGISKDAIPALALPLLPFLFMYASTVYVGGYCPPSRAMVPLMGAMVIFMAIGLERLFSRNVASYYMLLLSLSIAIVAFLFLNPYSIYRHDILSILSPSSIDLVRVFPLFTAGDPISIQPFFSIAFWMGIAIIIYVFMAWRDSAHTGHS